MNPKTLQPGDKVIQSLLALRKEIALLAVGKVASFHTYDPQELMFKINSCLYSTYPVTPKQKVYVVTELSQGPAVTSHAYTKPEDAIAAYVELVGSAQVDHCLEDLVHGGYADILELPTLLMEWIAGTSPFIDPAYTVTGDWDRMSFELTIAELD